MRALLTQAAQVALVLLLAPLLTGYVRTLKARLQRRRGPSMLQPWRDLLRLARKEAVVAGNASWLFRSTPYLVFATTWVAAALVPTAIVVAVPLLAAGRRADEETLRRIDRAGRQARLLLEEERTGLEGAADRAAADLRGDREALAAVLRGPEGPAGGAARAVAERFGLDRVRIEGLNPNDHATAVRIREAVKRLGGNPERLLDDRRGTWAIGDEYVVDCGWDEEE